MNILFLCVANSARSQIAEGLARHLLGDLARVESAGSCPSQVNPWAVRVLRDRGIDISRQYSKRVDQLDVDFLRGLDYVITLCAEEVCPVYLSEAKKLHWPQPDPAGVKGTEAEQLAAFQRTRDSLEQALQNFKNTFLS